MRHGQSIAQPFLFRYSNTMDLERLKFRSQVIQNIRSFFTNKGYLELDTPALSPDLIPETCLEVFKTEYIEPWSGRTRNLYLVPSPEIYIKKIIAQHNISVFQVSKCYRNVESTGRIVELNLTVRNVCPYRRTALGIILTEIDCDGKEHPRGMKTVTVPAHSASSCRDIRVKCIKFVLPDDIKVSCSQGGSMCGARNLRVRVIAHSIDTDYRCCDMIMTV